MQSSHLPADEREQWAGDRVNVLGHSYGGICALEAAC
jgi:predicted dienelactone hydrolase